MKAFFNDLLTETNPKSSKRFVTLIIATLFILTCLTVLVLTVCLFIASSKLQGVNISALHVVADLLKQVLLYEMAIVVMGLFVTTVKGRLEVIRALFKGNAEAAQTASDLGDPPPKPIQE